MLAAELAYERQRIAEMEVILHEELEKNAGLQAELDAVHANPDGRKRMLGSLDPKVTQKEAERKTTKMQELEDLVKDLQERLLASDVRNMNREDIENLKRRLKNSEEEVEDLKSALLQADKTAEELQAVKAECESLNQQLTESRREVKRLKDQADRLEGEVRRLRTEQADLSKGEPDSTALEAELQRLRDENALLKNELRAGRRISKPPEPTTPNVRASRIPIGRRIARFCEPEDRSTKSDDETLARRVPASPAVPLAEDWLESDARHSPVPLLHPKVLSPRTMSARVDELVAERSEIERQLRKALPKERGAALARLRQEREQMEVRLEEVSREIAKFRLDIHFAEKSKL
jgi:DNA repair exonuclease SbcCD ATPase subunit